MAVILCLETSTTNCSVALSKDGNLVALKEDNSAGYSHAEKLHVFIDELLVENDLDAGALDAVAISKGPGSYTGLRIGVSAAKGLCFSLDIPLISVPTLTALALQARPGEGDLVIPMLDARRMEVYSAVFDAEIQQIRETRAEVLSSDSFKDLPEHQRLHFIGNGVAKFKEITTISGGVFYEGLLPSSKEMAAMAYTKYQNSQFEDVAYFEPYYLKDFVAG